MARSKENHHIVDDRTRLSPEKNYGGPFYSSSGEEDGITVYEQSRQANLARNKAYLESLGVPALVADMRTTTGRAIAQSSNLGAEQESTQTGSLGQHEIVKPATVLDKEKLHQVSCYLYALT